MPQPRSKTWSMFGALAVAAVAMMGSPASAQCQGIPQAPPNQGGGGGSTQIEGEQNQSATAARLYPVQGNNAFGLINRGGYLAVDRSWDWVDYAHEDMIRAIQGGRTGYARFTGDWVIQPRFVYGDRFEGGYAVVGNGRQFGIIDARGELIVPIRLDGALRFKEGLAAVQVGNRVGFIDVRGEVVIPLDYAMVRSFHQNYAAFKTPETEDRPAVFGYLDKRGEVAWADRTGQVRDLGDFNENLAAVQIGEKWGYLSRRFRGEIQPQFDAARDFSDGLAAVLVDDKWGYIDTRGRWVIEPQYDDADEFTDGVAMVKVGEHWGYIDKRGRWTIEPQYTYAEPFFRSYARVAMEPNFGYIDSSGRAMWDPGAAGVTPGPTEREQKPWLSATSAGLTVENASPLGPYVAEHLYEERLPAADDDDGGGTALPTQRPVPAGQDR